MTADVRDETGSNQGLADRITDILTPALPLIEEVTGLPIPRCTFRLVTPQTWMSATRDYVARGLQRNFTLAPPTPAEAKGIAKTQKAWRVRTRWLWPQYNCITLTTPDGQPETLIAPQALRHTGLAETNSGFQRKWIHEAAHHAQIHCSGGRVAPAPFGRPHHLNDRMIDEFIEAHADWAELTVTYNLNGQEWPDMGEARRTTPHTPVRAALFDARNAACAGWAKVRRTQPAFRMRPRGQRMAARGRIQLAHPLFGEDYMFVVRTIDAIERDAWNETWTDPWLVPTQEEFDNPGSWLARRDLFRQLDEAPPDPLILPAAIPPTTSRTSTPGVPSPGPAHPDALPDLRPNPRSAVTTPPSPHAGEQHTSLFVQVAVATREGTGGPLADAAYRYTAADGTTAGAVIDCMGHTKQAVAIAPVLAEVAARTGAVRGALAGILSTALLVQDRGPAANGPRAVAAAAVCRPNGSTLASWVGDCRIYGWDGSRLHQYSTDHTLAEQLRQRYQVTEELAAQFNQTLQVDLTSSTVATVPEVWIPAEELVVITSDGAHDQITRAKFEELVREHADEPDRLARALVAAAETNEHGTRDDATVLILAPRAKHKPAWR